MSITVFDLMTAAPASVLQGTTIAEATDVLLQNDAAEIYVVDDAGRLIGMVPDFELLKSQMIGQSRMDRIESLMTQHVTTVPSAMAVAEVAPRFREGWHNCMPVVDDGQLVGQISRRDVLRLRQTLTALESPENVSQESADMDNVHVLRGPRFLERNRRPEQRRPAGS
jgi:CBS domain-containing protein